MTAEVAAMLAGAVLLAWAAWACRRGSGDLRHDLRALRDAFVERPTAPR